MDAQRLAFVCPRYASGPTVGGAETLLKQLALQAVAAGLDVTFLTTCARNHFTWENEIPAGRRVVDGLTVHFFPVDTDRDVPRFLRLQEAIGRGRPLAREEELAWLRHSVNSTALCEHLRLAGASYDRIVAGPYLFGLTYHASQIAPDHTLLAPCLHDEPFARVGVLQALFNQVRGILFNAEPERELAVRLFGLQGVRQSVVGMGLDPFAADPAAFDRQHPGWGAYLMYAGRREPLKGTPLLLDYLEAFRSRTARDVKLVLTGSGPIDPPAALADQVLDLGFVSEEEKQQAMAGALAFCHPSVNESLGIVLLEAWLAGAPALVHGGGAVLPDHCRRSGGGLWFTNYGEFEEELLLLLDQPALRRQLGQSGCAYVRREYAWPVIRQRLLTALA